MVWQGVWHKMTNKYLLLLILIIIKCWVGKRDTEINDNVPVLKEFKYMIDETRQICQPHHKTV
jgi:hypothetical protein